jgi:putative ABC transport system substrate-binding protein
MRTPVKRRDAILLLGGAVAAWPLAARAQQSTRPTVAFVRSTSAASARHLVAAFRRGLNEAGFVEGKNVTVDYHWAEDQLDHLPDLAQEVVRRKPAVIVGNVLAMRAVKAATTSIPIVFVAGSDPVKIGLVSSLNRPGENLTGVVFTSSDLAAKRLGLLDALVPKSSAIALLLDPTAPGYELEKNDAEEAGRTIGRRILIAEANDERELHAAFATFAKRGAGGLVIGTSAFFLGRRVEITILAARYGLPATASLRSFAEGGLLTSYGASQADAYRRAGNKVGDILNGGKPGEMPVELATKFQLVINRATARALAIDIPPTLLAIADEVIE